MASSFMERGADTRTRPLGGRTARWRFLMGLRTTRTSMPATRSWQISVLMLVLDDLE